MGLLRRQLWLDPEKSRPSPTWSNHMADFVIRVGSRSAQGKRSNNEDRLIADVDHQVFLVADGMGGQDSGEKASGMAVDIIPRAVQEHIAAHEKPEEVLRGALEDANKAIIAAGSTQRQTKRMGTTAVIAMHQDDKFWVANLGDSRAYLIRTNGVQLLTVDHTVAEALVRNGALSPEQARHSPWKNVLYKFLGCVEMAEGPDIHSYAPRAGDRLLLATDGMTNHVGEEDLTQALVRHHHPQEAADYLVNLSLERGSKDNVSCILIAFDAE